jgi:hypothetical protein
MHFASRAWMVAGLIVIALISGATAGCGLNDPVMASGNGLKKKLKNREVIEIQRRHTVPMPVKSRR